MVTGPGRLKAQSARHPQRLSPPLQGANSDSCSPPAGRDSAALDPPLASVVIIFPARPVATPLMKSMMLYYFSISVVPSAVRFFA